MTTPELGQVLRLHLDNGFRDLGRVVLLIPVTPAFWIVPMPPPRSQSSEAGVKSSKEKFEFAADFEIRRPRRWTPDQVTAEYSFVDFNAPRHWGLHESELKSGVADSDIVGTRANIIEWHRVREVRKSWTRPIFDEFGLFELLECGQLNDQVKKRAEILGVTRRKLMQVILLQVFGVEHRNALLPAYGNCGVREKPKLSENKPGRRRDPVRRGVSENNGYHCSADDRARLVKGWRKYKKPSVSEYTAYLLTMTEYWPGDESVSNNGQKFLLRPPLDRPSLGQFRSCARRERLNATRANMSDRVHHECHRALRGTATDGIAAVGQVMLIDSTSEDETPVSQISILDILPSTWRTVVFDTKSEYIFGVHSGFENPSTMTSLLAINNAASPKSEFCARYGIELEVGQWYSRAAKRFRADNGELKSVTGIATLNDSEMSAEFTRSYGASYKGQVEANHKSLHAHADHTHAGSTHGRQRERGEPKRENDACRTHHQNMSSVIEAILRHNNEVPVPHLLTLEMRQDGIAATRRAIYEWYVKKGYVASEPLDLDSIRIECLPRLHAVIAKDGVYVFDPRIPNAQRHIKNLVYSSSWLLESGLCEKAGRRAIRIVIQIDPNDLSCCYMHRAGILRRLERRTRDSLANELTLCEHLLMTDSDKDAVEPIQQALEEGDARRAKENRAVNADSRLAMRKAQLAQKVVGNHSLASSKRENRTREMVLEERRRLGIDQSAASGMNTFPAGVPKAIAVPQDSEPATENVGVFIARSATSSLMSAVRAARRSRKRVPA